MSKPKTETAAAAGAEAVAPNGTVKVRVLPNGDGRIATGLFGVGESAYHKKGDHLFLAPDLAKTQEDAGLVEIVDGA